MLELESAAGAFTGAGALDCLASGKLEADAVPVLGFEAEEELAALEALSASLLAELVLTCEPDLSSTGTSLSFTPEAQAARRLRINKDQIIFFTGHTPVITVSKRVPNGVHEYWRTVPLIWWLFCHQVSSSLKPREMSLWWRT